ncbi:MAG TPA: amino acid transporter [Blastocatellia bacterium]|nr:amino acid transporter [Blastocatellia bacterium]
MEGPHEKEGIHHTHTWWQVMCLTGVDYFSTLGYQPGIAFLAAGALSPIATLVLVFLTLFGALPMYNRVAEASPHGDGSISMLENLLPKWKGKLFVLALLGFVATSFIITITLSAADATAHVIENPYAPDFFHHQRIGLTIFLIAGLGAVFLKGFKEAIGIAVLIVVVFILMNLVVVGVGFYHLAMNPQLVSDWTQSMLAHPQVNGSPLLVIGVALFLFPKLALGLSGFETGVVVMPLVKGDPTDTEEKPAGRIRNTKKLLLSAALIMSVMLILSSLITTTLIPPEEFRPATEGQPAGKANGRALAYIAHLYLGDIFGTAYDLSTIFILWFAGASALAGLLNIVPRYLPRYGMAPEWARATRPLTVVFTAICFLVTVLFAADVSAQGGAYATGVLALMTSAAIAVTLAEWKRGRWTAWAFLLISLVFVYTTLVNVFEQPSGIKIASMFIVGIVVTSIVSRIWRTTELRVERIELDEEAEKIISEMCKGDIRLIANQCDTGDADEYMLKEKEQREDNHIPKEDPVFFFEVSVPDASEFTDVLEVRGKNIDGYHVLRAESSAVPNAIAAFMLYLRDRCGKTPHIYFEWTKGNPLPHLFNYIIFGEGDTGPVTREVLRQAEPDYERRPFVHVGGE